MAYIVFCIFSTSSKFMVVSVVIARDRHYDRLGHLSTTPTQHVTRKNLCRDHEKP